MTNNLNVPAFKFKNGMNFQNFLLNELIFTEEELSESKKIAEKSPFIRSNPIKLARFKDFPKSDHYNPGLVFSLSIEYRLMKWGLKALSLPVPQKLSDMDVGRQ